MEVSSHRWKEASIHSIKLAQTVISRSNVCLEDGRIRDPLPLLRDACVQESNSRIFAHMRSTRDVVMRLRKSLVATNEEIKSLNRSKESLEKALEHKRKNIALNQESIDIRTHRPAREKDTDIADRLLHAEQTHLLSLKKSLEAQLTKVQLQLQQLNQMRARLSSSIQERSRITDLICQSMMPTNSTSLELPRPFSARGSWTNRSNASSIRSSRSQSVLSQTDGYQLSYNMVEKFSGTPQSTPQKHSKSYSVPLPQVIDEGAGNDELTGFGPYGALSPEAMQSMTLARDAISHSQTIRREAADAIDHTKRLQKAAHSSVNEGITRKLAQTVTMTQHLQVNIAETKLAHQKGQRYYNAQEKALGYMMGPVSSSDVTTRERLDRPIVQVYQRHPGTDLPEAAHFVQASAMYCDSMETTRKNMTLLKLANKRLREDLTDKKTSAKIDSSLVRLRRRKSDHRWILQGMKVPNAPARVRSITT